MYPLLRSLQLSLALILPAIAGTWQIDADHSTVGFKVKHLMVSTVTGSFPKFSGTVEINDTDITKSKVNVSIDVASIYTGVTKRDEHLRSPDFFDVAKYPNMTFVSTAVKASGKGKLLVTGNLTLHGVTKSVVLEVEGPSSVIKDPWGNSKRGTSALTVINRKDFGLTWNAALETGGVVVGEEVTIFLELEMIQK